MNLRILSFAAFLAATATLPMSAAEPAHLDAAEPLETTVFSFAALAAKPTPVGTFRRVTDRPTSSLDRLECHITTLNAGKQSHPPHHHPQEEFIILQTGTLDVFINGQVTRIGPGSMFFFASNDLHNVTNVGSAAATYFVFNVTTAATKRVPAKPAADWEPAADLHSSVFDWAKLPVQETPTGSRRNIVDAPTVTCTHFEAHVTSLHAGLKTAKSRHADDALLVVKDGEIELTVNGTVHRAKPGDVCFIASNEEHQIRNPTTADASYYAIRIASAQTPRDDAR